MRITLPLLAIVAAGTLALAEPAHASSPYAPGLAAGNGLVMGGRVVVGGGVHIPVGRSSRAYDGGVVEYGHWETRYREVRVYQPGPLLGYDRHGRAIYGEGHYVVHHEPYQVWVVERRVHRVHRVVRPVGYISLGGFWRIR